MGIPSIRNLNIPDLKKKILKKFEKKVNVYSPPSLT